MTKWYTAETLNWISREGQLLHRAVAMTTTTSRIDVEQAAPEIYRAMLRLDAAVGKSGLDPQLQEL